jgi:hypothetical protein
MGDGGDLRGLGVGWLNNTLLVRELRGTGCRTCPGGQMSRPRETGELERRSGEWREGSPCSQPCGRILQQTLAHTIETAVTVLTARGSWTPVLLFRSA